MIRHLPGAMPEHDVFDRGVRAPRIVHDGDSPTLLIPGRDPIVFARSIAPEDLTAILQLATELTDLRREGEALEDVDSAGLVASIAGAVAMWNFGPNWYPLALVGLALPTAWAGGRLRLMQVPERG